MAVLLLGRPLCAGLNKRWPVKAVGPWRMDLQCQPLGEDCPQSAAPLRGMSTMGCPANVTAQPPKDPSLMAQHPLRAQAKMHWIRVACVLKPTLHCPGARRCEPVSSTVGQDMDEVENSRSERLYHKHDSPSNLGRSTLLGSFEGEQGELEGRLEGRQRSAHYCTLGRLACIRSLISAAYVFSLSRMYGMDHGLMDIKNEISRPIVAQLIPFFFSTLTTCPFLLSLPMDGAEIEMVPSNAEPLGRRSIIADHCHAKKQAGHSECIFLCVRRDEQYYAIDIPVDENETTLGLDVLHKASGPWWKRFSLRSPISVQQVQMRFMSIEPAGRDQLRISVCIVPLDYTGDMQGLDKAIERELQDVKRACCGIDIDGNAEECYGCPNEGYDEMSDEPYCKIQQSRKLRQMYTEYEWLPSTLKYWWHNGVDARGLPFLRTAGFIYSYKQLQYDK